MSVHFPAFSKYFTDDASFSYFTASTYYSISERELGGRLATLLISLFLVWRRESTVKHLESGRLQLLWCQNELFCMNKNLRSYLNSKKHGVLWRQQHVRAGCPLSSCFIFLRPTSEPYWMAVHVFCEAIILCLLITVIKQGPLVLTCVCPWFVGATELEPNWAEVRYTDLTGFVLPFNSWISW